MAEGLLRYLGQGRFAVFSAGTHPAGLNPLAVRAMSELGIDIADQASESVEAYVDRPFDYVITVCDHARENCPVFPHNARQLHWGFDDPAGVPGTEEERMRVFRRVRDEIRVQLEGFVAEVEMASEG